MELRVLKYFLAVAHEGNITRAAESLHLTQPTLSRQIQDLEEELGAPLFLREKRRMELTDAGLLLKARAEEMTMLERKTLEQFAHLDEQVGGDVYFGCGETLAMGRVVEALRPLARAYPQVHFHFLSGNYEQTLDGIRKGTIDFGVLCLSMPPRDFVWREVPFDDHWCLYMRDDHPLTAKKSIVAKDILHEPLLLSRQMANGKEFDHWFGRSLSELNVRATYNLIYNALFLVEQGLGLAFSLEGLISEHTYPHEHIVSRPLAGAPVSHNFIVWKPEQTFSRAAVAVRARLEEVFRERVENEEDE